MKFKKTVNLWNISNDEIKKLQSGQWVYCGSGVKSIFDKALLDKKGNVIHVRCFHGGTEKEAYEKYKKFKAKMREHAEKQK